MNGHTPPAEEQRTCTPACSWACLASHMCSGRTLLVRV
jgi:hypothetical protein